MLTIRENTQDYRELIVSDTPLIDLRSPTEFIKGSFNHAVSLPLMTDSERAQVGTCYKQLGKDQAIALGHQLVCGDIKSARMADWLAFAQSNPNGYLFCFRGGLRSNTVQKWLADEGADYPLVEGGYKAMRRFLIDESLRIVKQTPIYVLSGFTGVGKTRLLHSFSQTVDLEGLANHRGSSFGRNLTAQPSQINFENNLATRLLKLESNKTGFLLLEDESLLIGARSIPLEIHQLMKQAPLIILQASLEERTEIIYQDYIIDRLTRASALGIEDPVSVLHNYLLDAIAGIKKRLGDEGYRHVQKMISAAIKSQMNQNNSDEHRLWISHLLSVYYDPMYRFQLAKKSERIIFTGVENEVKDFVNALEK